MRKDSVIRGEGGGGGDPVETAPDGLPLLRQPRQRPNRRLSRRLQNIHLLRRSLLPLFLFLVLKSDKCALIIKRRSPWSHLSSGNLEDVEGVVMWKAEGTSL
jgi:hypothetical protein